MKTISHCLTAAVRSDGTSCIISPSATSWKSGEVLDQRVHPQTIVTRFNIILTLGAPHKVLKFLAKK